MPESIVEPRVGIGTRSAVRRRPNMTRSGCSAPTGCWNGRPVRSYRGNEICMWVSSAGGFDTVAIADPLARLSKSLLEKLRETSGIELRELYEEVSGLEDAIFLDLKSLKLPEDKVTRYVGLAIPEGMVLRLPESEPIFDGLRAQILEVEPRWRLDLVLVLEDAIDALSGE